MNGQIHFWLLQQNRAKKGREKLDGYCFTRKHGEFFLCNLYFLTSIWEPNDKFGDQIIIVCNAKVLWMDFWTSQNTIIQTSEGDTEQSLSERAFNTILNLVFASPSFAHHLSVALQKYSAQTKQNSLFGMPPLSMKNTEFNSKVGKMLRFFSFTEGFKIMERETVSLQSESPAGL